MTTHDEQMNPTTTSVPADQPSSAHRQTDPASAQPAPITATDEPSATASPRRDDVTATDEPSATASPRRDDVTATDEPSATASRRYDDETSSDTSLFADNDLSGLRSRWNDVQASFVDDPKDCVQKADSLVADVVQQLTAGFSDARSRLEAQWDRGEEASTEDLRQALKRYRQFFERLLAV